MNGFLGFIEGKHDYLRVIDKNHNLKNVRYQVIGGNYVATIENWLVDAGILNKAIPKYL